MYTCVYAHTHTDTQTHTYSIILDCTTPLKWKFLVVLKTWLCHVMFLWKMYDDRMFCWSTYMRCLLEHIHEVSAGADS